MAKIELVTSTPWQGETDARGVYTPSVDEIYKRAAELRTLREGRLVPATRDPLDDRALTGNHVGSKNPRSKIPRSNTLKASCIGIGQP